MEQAVQLLGAILILTAYIASQQKRMRLDSAEFLGLNTAGAAILAVVAAVNRDYGFLLLEGVWTVVSAHGLRRVLRTKKQEAERANPKGRSKRPPGRAGRPARRRNRPNPLRRVE